MTNRTLGVCYYPEHWPEDIWAEDARRMAETGLTWVRIGEFAWSRMEPIEGAYDFDWLDRAIEVLGASRSESDPWHADGDAADLGRGKAS